MLDMLTATSICLGAGDFAVTRNEFNVCKSPGLRTAPAYRRMGSKTAVRFFAAQRTGATHTSRHSARPFCPLPIRSAAAGPPAQRPCLSTSIKVVRSIGCSLLITRQTTQAGLLRSFSPESAVTHLGFVHHEQAVVQLARIQPVPGDPNQVMDPFTTGQQTVLIGVADARPISPHHRGHAAAQLRPA